MTSSELAPPKTEVIAKRIRLQDTQVCTLSTITSSQIRFQDCLDTLCPHQQRYRPSQAFNIVSYTCKYPNLVIHPPSRKSSPRSHAIILPSPRGAKIVMSESYLDFAQSATLGNRIQQLAGGLPAYFNVDSITAAEEGYSTVVCEYDVSDMLKQVREEFKKDLFQSKTVGDRFLRRGNR